LLEPYVSREAIEFERVNRAIDRLEAQRDRQARLVQGRLSSIGPDDWRATHEALVTAFTESGFGLRRAMLRASEIDPSISPLLGLLAPETVTACARQAKAELAAAQRLLQPLYVGR
jgi:hypothetical protein